MLDTDLKDLLKQRLPTDYAEIKSSYANQQFDELMRQVHKLHGAVCYCDLPALRKILAELELNLKKNNLNDLDSLMHQLDVAVEKI